MPLSHHCSFSVRDGNFVNAPFLCFTDDGFENEVLVDGEERVICTEQLV